MKTKTLIEFLQKEDPKGDAEVLIGNMDILPIIYCEAGYWDGRMRLAEFDEGGSKHTPARIRVTSSGYKICLREIDPQDIFVMSLLDDQEEFDYDVEGGSKKYPYSYEQFRALDSKVGWLFVAEAWSGWYYNHESRATKKETTLKLIENLKLKYGTQAKEALISTIEERFVGNTKKNFYRLVELMYKHCPYFIPSATAWGTDYVTFEHESNRKIRFRIGLTKFGFGKGKVSIVTSKRENDRNIDVVEDFDWNEETIIEFAKHLEMCYKNRVND